MRASRQRRCLTNLTSWPLELFVQFPENPANGDREGECTLDPYLK